PVAILEPVRRTEQQGVRADRHPHVVSDAVERADESGGGDTDDGVGVFVEFYRAAEHGGVGVEVASPEPLADDGDGGGGGVVGAILGVEKTAEVWVHAERFEETAGDELSPDALGVGAAA